MTVYKNFEPFTITPCAKKLLPSKNNLIDESFHINYFKFSVINYHFQQQKRPYPSNHPQDQMLHK